MKFSLFSALLFSVCWRNAANRDESPRDCCLYVSDTRIPAENIVKYDMQEKSPCPVRAVIFHTKKSKTICSDPESKWAKRVMEIVDQRTTTTPSPHFTSTTNMIPTTTAAQSTDTDGNEPPESCCTTIPVNHPAAFGSLLTRKRSRSKKMLRKFQSNASNTKK